MKEKLNNLVGKHQADGKYFGNIYILLLMMLPLYALCGCGSDNDDVTPPSVKPDATGTMTDVRDGQIYHWVRFGGRDWIVENSKYNTGDENCSIYVTSQTIGQDYGANDSLTVKNYGYLYNYKGASEAAPDGWRLPSDDDWKSLEKALGMTADDTDGDGWRGTYQATLLQQGSDGTGLRLLLGGMEDANSTSFASHYLYMQAYGYYWTATGADATSSTAYIRKIQYNSPQVWRHSSSVKNMFSVRFVRDAQ